ncbi:MAG: hypothetical protein ACP5M0_03880 [Desulfomonilaceae bacterium]
MPHNLYSFGLAMWGVNAAGCGGFYQGERLCEKALSSALELDHLVSLEIAETGRIGKVANGLLQQGRRL